MAYLNRTIRLAFDGTDKKLPQLGDDIFVTIKNPLLMPASMVQTDTPVQTDAQGNVLNTNEAMQAGFEIAARLIVDWCVYDPDDASDEPLRLPLPATADMMRRLPIAISNAIGEIVGKAMAPTT